MAFPLLARKALLIVLGLALAGCAKEDGGRIIGKWRAERFEVMSLKLPVGPELEITQHELSTGSDVSLPIKAITRDGEAVTLETDGFIGMTFYFVEPDRMYVELPIVGRIYYRRVNDPAVVTAAGTVPEAGAAGTTHVRVSPTFAPVPLPIPKLHPVTRSAEPASKMQAYARDYAQALELARQGDRDGAVRCLYDAFTNGFRDVALLSATREFDSLKSDVRYQALLARYTRQ